MAALLGSIGPGDEVIMPSFTFVSTANAFALRGGVPEGARWQPQQGLDPAGLGAVGVPLGRREGPHVQLVDQGQAVQQGGVHPAQEGRVVGRVALPGGKGTVRGGEGPLDPVVDGVDPPRRAALPGAS